MENRVYKTVDSVMPLAPSELAYEANLITSCKLSATDYPKRISGKGLCNCTDYGEFILLPIDNPAVREGGKRYMYCRKCGCSSHL